jgi:hypothetical protein
MNTRFKVFASYNILQYLCDFIHVLKFVIVSKCRKNPKLTNIVIEVEPGIAQAREWFESWGELLDCFNSLLCTHFGSWIEWVGLWFLRCHVWGVICTVMIPEFGTQPPRQIFAVRWLKYFLVGRNCTPIMKGTVLWSQEVVVKLTIGFRFVVQNMRIQVFRTIYTGGTPTDGALVIIDSHLRGQAIIGNLGFNCCFRKLHLHKFWRPGAAGSWYFSVVSVLISYSMLPTGYWCAHTVSLWLRVLDALRCEISALLLQLNHSLRLTN